MVAADSDFYDEAYESYPPYETTPMRPMYEWVAKTISRFTPVIDLGCGNGYLASALKLRDYKGEYVGYDFSNTAIEQANLLFDSDQLQLFDEYKFFKFEVKDLRHLYIRPTESIHRTSLVCLEVLEHLDDDVDLVESLPARSRLVFSVPNYWSESHVRTYDSVGVAFKRFGHLLNFTNWTIFPTEQEGAAIYLYDTRRKADAW